MRGINKKIQNFDVRSEDIAIINQLFELHKKVNKLKEENTIDRNLNKLNDILANVGLTYEEPLGEKFDETRTDCEAHIAGDSTENLFIVDVLKPIIRYKTENCSQVIQKAVVIVQSKFDGI